MTTDILVLIERLLSLREGMTGGAWHATNHFADDTTPCNCAYVLSEGYAGSICTISVDNGIPSIADGGNDCPPRSEAAANARAIAALPDLLDLLSSYHSLAQDAGFSDVGEALAKAKVMREALLDVAAHFDGDLKHKDWLETERVVRSALATGEPA